MKYHEFSHIYTPCCWHCAGISYKTFEKCVIIESVVCSTYAFERASSVLFSSYVFKSVLKHIFANTISWFLSLFTTLCPQPTRTAHKQLFIRTMYCPLSIALYTSVWADKKMRLYGICLVRSFTAGQIRPFLVTRCDLHRIYWLLYCGLLRVLYKVL